MNEMPVFQGNDEPTDREIVQAWLTHFETALQARETAAIVALFQSESHWRDCLAFT